MAALFAFDGLESALRDILSQLARQASDLAALRADTQLRATRADLQQLQESLSAVQVMADGH